MGAATHFQLGRLQVTEGTSILVLHRHSPREIIARVDRVRDSGWVEATTASGQTLWLDAFTGTTLDQNYVAINYASPDDYAAALARDVPLVPIEVPTRDGPWVIFDLDGTLCDTTHREHLARERKWDEFHAGLMTDPPRVAEVVTLRALAAYGCRIAIATARPERFRTDTWVWFAQQQIAGLVDVMLMRADGDYRSSTVVKLEMYELIADLGPILMALEDRDKVVAMWRGCGVACFHVQPGAY